MKIEAGKTYVTRSGFAVGPMEVNVPSISGICDLYAFVADNAPIHGAKGWTAEGYFFASPGEDDRDLVSEYVEHSYSDSTGTYSVGYTATDVRVLLVAQQDFANSPLGQAVKDAIDEVLRAKELWPGQANSAHEQYAVILEETDELWDHVKTNQKRRDLVAMRKEAIQVAAMALRFASEVCDEERGRR